MADVGTNATLTIGSTAFFTEILDIKHSGMERQAIDTTHLNSTVARSFVPSRLYDAGETTVEMLLNPDTQDAPFTALTQASTSVVITFPVPSGRTTGAKYTGTGFLRSFEANVPLEDRMTGTGVIKWTGTITKTTSV